MASLKDKTCIVGVGESEYSSQAKRRLQKTGMQLVMEAVTAAIADAGLHPKDIDGIIPTGRGTAFPAEAVAANLGTVMK